MNKIYDFTLQVYIYKFDNYKHFIKANLPSVEPSEQFRHAWHSWKIGLQVHSRFSNSQGSVQNFILSNLILLCSNMVH